MKIICHLVNSNRHNTQVQSTITIPTLIIHNMDNIYNNSNQPTSSPIGISKPHDHDVLCGRGGDVNIHPGNETFRKVVDTMKREYLTAESKREKRFISDNVLAEIKKLEPPGRFLARNYRSGLWYDVGYEKAKDKASQALRENAPLIRMEIEVERNQQQRKTHRSNQQFYREYHGPLYHSHSDPVHPTAYRQQASQPYTHNEPSYSRPVEVTPSSNYQTTPVHSDQLSHYHNNSGMDHNNTEGYENSRFRCSSAPPNLNFDCSMCMSNTVSARSVEDSTTTANIKPASNKNYIATSGLNNNREEGQGYTKQKTEKNTEWDSALKNPAPPLLTTSGCASRSYPTDINMISPIKPRAGMFSPMKQLPSRGDNSLKILQGIEIDTCSVRRGSNGSSIGGTSLIHVFDGDSDSVEGISGFKLPSRCDAKNSDVSDTSAVSMDGTFTSL